MMVVKHPEKTIKTLHLLFVFVFVVVAMVVVTRHLEKTINTGGKLVR